MKKRFKDKRQFKLYYYWKRCNVLKKVRWINVHDYSARFAHVKLKSKNDPIILKFQEVAKNLGLHGLTPYTSSNFADIKYREVLSHKNKLCPMSIDVAINNYVYTTPLHKQIYKLHHSIDRRQIQMFLKDDMLDYVFKNIITDMVNKFKSICNDYNVNFDIEFRYDFYEIIATMIYYEERAEKDVI
jgi:hypothetical protein